MRITISLFSYVNEYLWNKTKIEKSKERKHTKIFSDLIASEVKEPK